jgi:hypothetical protein
MKIIVMTIIILFIKILLFGKSFETQETISVKAAKETILEIPYNQNTTIQFPELVRTIWTSVSSNDMRVAKDKNFLQVSAKTESPVTVILADGSVFPIRFIPSKNVKTFAFNIQDTITRDAFTERRNYENKGDFVESGDIILLSEQEISILRDMYSAYFQYLEGSENLISEYQVEPVNKLITQIKSADVAECLTINAGRYIGKVYELRNGGQNMEIKDDDLIPFINSVPAIEGYSSAEAFFIDSYTLPAGRKTAFFVVYKK